MCPRTGTGYSYRYFGRSDVRSVFGFALSLGGVRFIFHKANDLISSLFLRFAFESALFKFSAGSAEADILVMPGGELGIDVFLHANLT